MKFLTIGIMPQKPHLLFVIYLLFSTTFFAQVGINTIAPDPSSELDIQSTDGGLLIPRMTATQRGNITNPAEGLLVYQTDTPEGFWYYDGSSWTMVGTSNEGWKLTGNTGTDDTVNFIGTIDDVNLIFKRNDVHYGIFHEDLIGGVLAIDNIGFGRNTLENISSGNSNTTFGNESLSSLTSGSENTAIGGRSLASVTSGGANTAVGYGVLENNVGVRNTGIGRRALQNHTSGNDNIAIGDFAMVSNSGESNLGIGNGTLATNDGDNNTAVGHNSLNRNSSGRRNVAVGYETLTNNTTGIDNSGFGTFSMSANTEGAFNSAFGRSSLTNNTTGNYNTAIGERSMLNNTEGDVNVAVGNSALAQNTISDFNTAVGTEALENSTGAGNTAIGALAFSTLVTGRFNAAIGFSTDVGSSAVERSTAIGAYAQVDTNNSIVLGAVNGVNGSLYNTNVGIGTTSPDARLDVVGTFQLQDGNENDGYVLATDASGNASWQDPNTLINPDDDWVSNGSDIERQSGDVYIGDVNTTNNDLYISGNIIDWDDNFSFLKPSALSRMNTIQFADGSSASPSIRFTDTNTGFYSPANAEMAYAVNGAERLRVDGAGNVGFRQANPEHNIHLKQNSATAAGQGGMAFENSTNTNKWKIYHSGTHFSFAENGIRRAYIETVSGDYVQPSDARLKQNFKNVSNFLPKLKQLQVYTYAYKNQTGNKRSLGVKAQEVKGLFPELISEGEDGYLGMNYAGLSVVAIQAIKEQQATIKELKEKNSRLEQQLTQILSRLEALENK